MIYAAVGRKAFVSSYCPHSWQRQMADITIDIEIQLSSVKHNGEVHIVHPLHTNLINCDMKVLLLMLTLSFIYPCDIIIFIFKVRVKVPGKYFIILSIYYRIPTLWLIYVSVEKVIQQRVIFKAQQKCYDIAVHNSLKGKKINKKKVTVITLWSPGHPVIESAQQTH